MNASPYDLEQRVVSQTGESAHSGHLDVFDLGLEQSYDYLSMYPEADDTVRNHTIGNVLFDHTVDPYAFDPAGFEWLTGNSFQSSGQTTDSSVPITAAAITTPTPPSDFVRSSNRTDHSQLPYATVEEM